ncbi:MAG: hypothetical protein A2516_04030 [Alphaproteobacteria bacterium RIFOXYD12_FULL_60_8]|nr:MAG: hypothetical protein A2516_04030 [Alphaproteobacteria bacterium RIFOXYD12_FULL_60_8]
MGSFTGRSLFAAPDQSREAAVTTKRRTDVRRGLCETSIVSLKSISGAPKKVESNRRRRRHPM